MVRRFILVLCVFLLLFILLSFLYVKFTNVRHEQGGKPVYNTNSGIGYNTIQEAIDAPETKDGNTITVGPGVFHEHLMLRKAVFLNGHSWQDTIIDGNRDGTVISVESSARIEGFTVENGSIGIFVESSNSGRIVDSAVRLNGEGIHLSRSSNWNISDNSMTNNYDSSLVLNDSDKNVFNKNEVSYDHPIVNDTVDLYNSSNNEISDNSLINNQAIAIVLRDHSSNNNVSQNLLMNDQGGVELVGSCNHNMIERNSIIVNETILGLTPSIWIRQSQFNTVYANEIMSNRTSSTYEIPYEDGVGLSESTNNVIVSNNISLMDTGIGFHYSCENNSIIGNTIIGNGHGIDFTEGVSDGNMIYSNNLIHNTEQVHIGSSSNIWDDGYPGGGNYWSDYETRYPNATEIDSLGMWSTPYVINSNNMDRYPLQFVVSQNPKR